MHINNKCIKLIVRLIRYLGICGNDSDEDGANRCIFPHSGIVRRLSEDGTLRVTYNRYGNKNEGRTRRNTAIRSSYVELAAEKL